MKLDYACRIFLMCFCFMFFTLGKIFAQESMMENFSYLYMEKLIAVAKENYPKIKGYSTKIDIAKSQVSMQKASWLDPFAFSYIYRSNTSIDLVNPDLLKGYQFGVTINPGVILKKPYAIRSAKEEVKVAQFDKLEYELSLETEVKRRYIAYLLALNSLTLKSKQLVDAESAFKFMKIKYEKNEVLFKDYTDSSLALNSAQDLKIEAEANLLTTKVSIEELLTKKLEEIK